MATRSSSASKSKSTRKKRTTKATAKKASPRRKRSTEPYLFHEVTAIIMMGLAVMLLLALISYSPADLPSWVPFSSQSGQSDVINNFIGPVGAVAAGYTYFFFGVVGYLLPAIGAWWAVQVLTGARPIHARNVISVVCLLVSAACLIEFQPWFFTDWANRINLPKSAGGFVGYGLGNRLIEQLLGSVGSVIVMGIVYTVALIVVTGIHPFHFAVMVRHRSSEFFEDLRERGPLFGPIRLPSFPKGAQ